MTKNKCQTSSIAADATRKHSLQRKMVTKDRKEMWKQVCGKQVSGTAAGRCKWQHNTLQRWTEPSSLWPMWLGHM